MATNQEAQETETATETLPKMADTKSNPASNVFVVTGLLVASAGMFASVKRRKEN